MSLTLDKLQDNDLSHPSKDGKGPPTSKKKKKQKKNQKTKKNPDSLRNKE